MTKEMSLTSVCPNEAHSRTWRKKESNQVLLGYDIRVRIGAYLRSESVISLGLGKASKRKVLIELSIMGCCPVEGGWGEEAPERGLTTQGTEEETACLTGV